MLGITVGTYPHLLATEQSYGILCISVPWDFLFYSDPFSFLKPVLKSQDSISDGAGDMIHG